MILDEHGLRWRQRSHDVERRYGGECIVRVCEVVPSEFEPFSTELLKALSAAARNSGYELLAHAGGSGGTDNEAGTDNGPAQADRSTVKSSPVSSRTVLESLSLIGDFSDGLCVALKLSHCSGFVIRLTLFPDPCIMLANEEPGAQHQGCEAD